MTVPYKQVPRPSDYVGFREEWIQQSIPALIEHQFETHADKVAIVSQGSSLTYAELNNAANRIAGAILERSPYRQPADSAWEEDAVEPVALFLEQGIDAVVAIVGLLKAGKMLLFLDPDDPYTRNRHLLNHAPARIVITNEDRLAVARELAPKETEFILVGSGGGNECRDFSLRELPPSTPASLVYTSGSTGRPKGIMHTHGCILHDIFVKTGFMMISPGDRMALLAWGTGQALKVVLSALCNGATLCLYNLKQRGVGRLPEYLLHEQVSILTISSPVFRAFSDALTDGNQFPTMRIIRLASDTVYPQDVIRCRGLFPNASMVNALSSNETGTIAGLLLDADQVAEMDHVPIGYPMEGMDVVLESESGGVVEADNPGTLVVKSRYIAQGYWRDPERSEGTFSADQDELGRVVFRSGDLARWNPDGSLQLCGRRDFQVKIRGYRVDLHEVEARLMEHPDIVEAVVQPVEANEGDKRLVGYFVSRTNPAPTASELMRFLKGKVTDYMIPVSFVSLKRIPLLPNGKTNRRALPEPGHKRPDLDTDYVAPRNGVEQELADIWSSVTGIEQVGIHDPFMELGGDSLRAGQVMARVLEVFGVDLPLPVLFDCPTVASLAVVIENRERRSEAQSGHGPSIRREGGAGPFQLSYGQQRLWFLDQLDPDSTAYNMPKLIQLTGAVDIEALAGALEWILRRHEVLRTHYRSRGGEPYAIVEDPGTVPLPIVDLTHLEGSPLTRSLDEKVHAESLRRFDLEHDLKLRSTLFKTGPEQFYLLCVTHHIASDGWSRGILMRELSSHYRSLARGEFPVFEELPIQYSDFARHQLEESESGTIKAQVDWWKQVLANYPRPVELPADRPRLDVLSSRGAALVVRIPRNRSTALEDLASNQQVTLFMLLMAAFNVLIYRYTGIKDILVGFPIAGRSAVETEDLIGFFVNSLILRTDLSGNPTFPELLSRVRDRALGAYANPDVPFEKLVNELRVKRELNRNPLFQVLFDVHRLRSPHMEVDGVVFEMMESKRTSTVVDQSWNLAVSEEGLRLRIEYSTDLFDQATVQAMADEYCRLLDAILENPDAPVDLLAHRTANNTMMKSEVSEAVADVWKTLLDEPPDNDQSDFFESGGHSLHVMRFVASINSRLGIRLSVREFFNNPVFGELVDLIAQKTSDNDS